MRGIHSGWKEQQEQTYRGAKLTSMFWNMTHSLDWSTWDSTEMFTVSRHVSFSLPVCLSTLAAG